MLQQPGPLRGDYLPGDLYFQDFYSRLQQMTGESWKLERRQTFAEPDSPSWEAARRGDWDGAQDELVKRYDGLRAYYQQLANQGITMYRVRIVERPLTRTCIGNSPRYGSAPRSENASVSSAHDRSPPTNGTFPYRRSSLSTLPCTTSITTMSVIISPPPEIPIPI